MCDNDDSGDMSRVLIIILAVGGYLSSLQPQNVGKSVVNG